MDYSKSLFTSSIKIFLIILVIIFLIFIINNLFSSFYSFLFSNTGIIEKIIIIVYPQYEKELMQNYNFIQKKFYMIYYFLKNLSTNHYLKLKNYF